MEFNEADNETMQLLSKWNAIKEPISEAEICDALRPIRQSAEDLDRTSRIWMEEMAFLFSEGSRKGDNPWGTYFGPFMTGRNDQGYFEAPSIEQVTVEILDYWAKRAEEVTHPVLKARYAGLVWDFSKHVTGSFADVSFAHKRIDSILEMASSDSHKYDIDVINKLEHALSLSLQIGNDEKLERVKNAIFSYEDKIAEDDKPGLWGFSFELLLNNKKIQLTEEQEQKILSDLEIRLEKVSHPNEQSRLNPWAAEKAATALAQYYKLKNKNDDIKRVLTKFGSAFAELASSANATLASLWMENVAKVYSDFGLRAEAGEIFQEVHVLWRKAKDEMREISVPISIEKANVDKIVEGLIEGEIESSIAKIVYNLIPRKDDIENQLRESTSSAPVFYHFQRRIVDPQGKPVARIGPITEDVDGHIVRKVAENITSPISIIVLKESISAFVNKHDLSPNKFLEILYRSPLFRDEKKEILRKGIEAYLRSDSITAIHLLIPQIEDGVRHLIEMTGGSVGRYIKKYGVYTYRGFGALLDEESVGKTFGESAAKYLKVLFADPRGLNLRNDVCHGQKSGEALNSILADRVFHALLLIGLAREKHDE